jgi:hypothetical protein
MKLRIHYVLPFCFLFACDKVERDWSKCNDTDHCKNGFACVNYLCVPSDAGGGEVAASPPDANGREVAGIDAATLDVPVDAPQVDAAADASGDTRPVDGAGSCGSDIDCPSTAPMCLDFVCAKCTGTSDCAGRGASSAVCDTTSGRCVACAKSSDCTADPAKPVCVTNQCVACSSATSECHVKSSAAPVCDGTSGKCVGCLANGDCAGSPDGGVDGGADGGVAAGVCNLTTNQCVGCLSHANCNDPSKPICGSSQTCVGCNSQIAPVDGCTTKNPALPVCKATTGVCVQCAGSSDCAGDAGLGVCDPTTNKCVECNGNADCTADPAKGFCVNNACTGCQTAPAGSCTGTKPVCATSGTSAGQCVECSVFGDCKVATKPVCDANQCRACAKDSDCTNISPAVVCGLDGSCPSDSAVIYLQNSSSCSGNPGNGSAASPYCSSDAATSALSATKTVIVIKGPLAVGNLTLNFTQKPVLIAGQSSANLTKPTIGTPPLVNITAGEVTLRDLTIPGGSDAGVSVSGGAILHMDRCYVTSNTKNGIITDKSAFDIVNTVIATNGGSAYSGVTLGAYSGTGPTRFAFNTVVNNGLVGVACGQPYTLTGILATGNGGLNVSSSCVIDSTTSTSTTPNFGTNYHLTASSPCVNAGGATCPPDDIDGDTRPIGTACDCGADEYKP